MINTDNLMVEAIQLSAVSVTVVKENSVSCKATVYYLQVCS